MLLALVAGYILLSRDTYPDALVAACEDMAQVLVVHFDSSTKSKLRAIVLTSSLMKLGFFFRDHGFELA